MADRTINDFGLKATPDNADELPIWDTVDGITKKTTIGGIKSGAVPYTGATGDVNLGTYSTIEDSTKYNLTPSITPQNGQVYWDAADATLAVDLDVVAGVTLQVGQEQHIRAVNKTGSPIPDGTAVYISGAQGNRPTISLAKADVEGTSKLVGITTQTIADNLEGYVTISGVVRGFNTSTFTAGDILYLSAATAGQITKTVPSSPNFITTVGVALNSTNNGSILVIPRAPLNANTSLSTSNTVPATEGAVKAYADTKMLKSASSTNGTIPTWDGTSGNALNGSGLTVPSGSLVGTTATQNLSNKTYLLGENSIKLDDALSADGTWSGITEVGTAGETLAHGNLCYFKAADSKWWKADANLSATYDKKLAMCLGDPSADQSTEFLLIGKIRADSLFPTMTIGSPVYMSETAGAVTSTQPTTADVAIRVIGYANTADELWFNPSPDYIVHA